MNHKDILKRSWDILWSYKVLWVFGIILALTTASGGERTIQYSGDRGNRAAETTTTPDFMGESFQEGFDEMAQEFDKFFSETFPEEWNNTIITVAIVAGCLILIMIVMSIIFRYLSRTSLIKMVDEYEDTGIKHTIREGFRIGWSRTAWHMALIDLLICLPTIIFFVMLFLFIFAPLALWATDNVAAGIFGTVLSIGLFFIGIILAIVVGAVLSLLLNFFRRACAMEELVVIESIKRGYHLVRQNLTGVLLMWLIIVGINIGYTIAIIPVIFMMMLAAAVIAAVFGLIAAGTVGLLMTPWIVGLAVAIPIFILVLAVPALFIDGLRHTYISSVWTLTYREMQALESLKPEHEDIEPLPELEEPS